MLPDKMAISHSNHLFMPVAFVFCLLSPLIHASNSYDYTDSRQFEKNPAISRHGNNIQRLPNYNWKPPDKYYGPRYSGKPQKKSTETNLGMEFTKPENPEQKMADPWVKEMQEINRQEREKWAAYRRNVKLTLDNVEETTKARKLTNNESITIPMLSKSKEYYENLEEGSELPIKLFEENESLEGNAEFDPATSKQLVWHLPMDQDSTGVKDDSSGNRFHDYFWLNSKQSTDTNVDETSNKKFKNDEWSTDIKDSSEKFLQKAPVMATHEQHKDYEISDINEDPFFKWNAATTDYEKSELEKDRPSSITNSHPEESISQQFKDSHILKSSTRTHKNFTKSSENDRNLNHTNNSKEFPVKKYSRQFNSFQNIKKESSKDNKQDEEKMENMLMQKSKKNDNINSHPEKSISQQSKILYVFKSPISKNFKKFSKTSKNLNQKTDSQEFSVKEYPKQSSPSQNDEENEYNKKADQKTITAKLLMLKSKEEKDDAEGKDTPKKLNYEKSFHSGRWGMSVLSPPAEFLKAMSRRLKHWKNEKQTEKDEKHHLFDQWGMSIASPPKKFFEDIVMHQGPGTKRLTKQTKSRPNEVKGSSDDQSPIHQSRRNLQTALIQQLMTDERYKKLAETLFGKVPNNLYDSKYPGLNYWNNYPTNVDLNNNLFLGFLMQALRSYIWQDDIDIPMSCRMRIPYAPSHT